MKNKEKKQEKEKKEKRQTLKSFGNQVRTNKTTFVAYLVLRMFVILALVISILRGNYENMFFCILTLILFMIPTFVEKSFGIDIPSTLEIIILLFIFSAEILGELQCYYVKFAHWDTMLHTVNGFLCAAVGFSLVDIFNRNKKFQFKLSPVFLAVVAFCFSMTVGVLWEFYEFGSDMLFHTDMQKDHIINTISSVYLNPDQTNSPVIIEGITDVIVNGESLGIGGYLDIGLIDTMKDLITNFVGAVVFSIIGYFHVKNRGTNKFAKQFIPQIKETSDLNKEQKLE